MSAERVRLDGHATVRTCAAGAAGLFVIGLAAPAGAQCTYLMKGKISRNFYRIPYGNGELVIAGSQYFTHGGAMDFVGLEPPHTIVAVAPGVIEGLDDSHNECGFHGAFCCCVNWIGVRHANNEISRYYHIRQGTASALGLAPGVTVTAGQPLGIEGDVGITGGNPGSSAPRTGPCVPTLPLDYDFTWGCQDHCHFAIFRGSTGELLVPMTCNIGGNRYNDQVTYTGQDCTISGCLDFPQEISNRTYDGLGTAGIYQNLQTITATTFVIRNQASAVIHSARNVRLLPGFQAGAGNAYFRAEIGPCNTTAVGQDNAIATTTWQAVCCGGGCPPRDGGGDPRGGDPAEQVSLTGVSHCGPLQKTVPLVDDAAGPSDE